MGLEIEMRAKDLSGFGPVGTNGPKPVNALAVALFEAYARIGGHNPNEHYDRNAAEQWMAQALAEVGVTDLITAAAKLADNDFTMTTGTAWVDAQQVRAAIAYFTEARA